jgi:hypothetical protein
MEYKTREESLPMPTRYLNVVLTVIAVLLAMLVVRPLLTPEPAHAAAAAQDVFFEPGTTLLRAPDGSRQVMGKVVIDLRSGNVWGFPTASDVPYPADAMKSGPITSKPFLLGRFDLEAMQ